MSTNKQSWPEHRIKVTHQLIVSAVGGAIACSNSNLKVTNSIFKKNRALQVTTPGRGGGGAISMHSAVQSTQTILFSAQCLS